ncbi:MAG: excinuclease ABC subunit UvrC [Gemmatimonadetes bacterium]|nr:excinuclease ABC subunit UvrC [Gemmatimonadota bacterium]MYG86595.1 excinuclease ABC subunit UvrC [Gemmatimonadota bacterium]MYJ89537.1 excinuclease ABC subunit UvrC [Gemmatimonadota bacterium]
MAVEPTEIEKKLKSLPGKPGVYLMKDARSRIIYVGKTRALRQRIRSYFQKTRLTAPKSVALASRIRDFDYVATESEVDALLLEDHLIKEHKPKYNVMLRDDKSFPFIMVTNEAFPRVVVTRNVRQDGARYFGPYTNVKAMRRTIDLVRKVFPLRTCPSAKAWPSMDRPCLDYYIDRCPGPCKGHIGEEGYGEIIEQVCQFLSGRTKDLLNRLKERMARASEQLQFELAGRIRDQIVAIEKTTIRQRAFSNREVDRDIIGLARNGTDVCGAVLQVREGKLLGKEHFFLTAPEESTEPETLGAFLTQYYLAAQLWPDEILLTGEPDGMETFREWMARQRGSKVEVVVPRRGDKAAMVRLATQNAELQLNTHALKRAETRVRRSMPASVGSLQEVLGLEAPPRRVETFDISNIQGSDPVASLVCFVDGRPRKSDYRKFKVRDVIGPNDFAMMQEVVGRRYRRLIDENKPLPDLVLIDGGKGQLSSVRQVLNELGLVDLPVIGLAKRLEEVFRPGQSEPILVPRSSPALKMLMQARDEAHRFAVTFHRQQRGRRMIRSELDNIPGVGPKRKQQLILALGSVENIRKCSEEELRTVQGVGKDAARKVYRYFHPEAS